MNWLDIAIMFLLAYALVRGFMRGLLGEIVLFVGFFAIIIIAFLFKEPVALFLYDKLPILNFGEFFKGITVINIFVYELLAFLIVFSVLYIILRIVEAVTKVITWIFRVLLPFVGLPFRFIAAGLSFVRMYIIIYFILFFVTLPVFNYKSANKSTVAPIIVNETPIVSKVFKRQLTAMEEIADLKNKFDSDTDSNTINLEALDVMLKHKIVTVRVIDKLVASEKLKIENIESVLEKYRSHNEEEQETENEIENETENESEIE